MRNSEPIRPSTDNLAWPAAVTENLYAELLFSNSATICPNVFISSHLEIFSPQPGFPTERPWGPSGCLKPPPRVLRQCVVNGSRTFGTTTYTFFFRAPTNKGLALT